MQEVWIFPVATEFQTKTDSNLSPPPHNQENTINTMINYLQQWHEV